MKYLSVYVKITMEEIKGYLKTKIRNKTNNIIISIIISVNGTLSWHQREFLATTLSLMIICHDVVARLLFL